jgi:thioredoxin-like negative regulator of GroEL
VKGVIKALAGACGSGGGGPSQGRCLTSHHHQHHTTTQQEYGGSLKVVKVNHTPNPEIIAKYKVYGLPTLMVFNNGALVPSSHREGAITKALLQKYIEQHVPAAVKA